MKRLSTCVVRIAALSAAFGVASAGQVPGAASDTDVPISHRDRVYAAEQFSNTVSVTDPVDNRLLGVIRLGEPSPTNFSPLYRGQVLVHGMGFSPDHRTLAVISVGSNSVTFVDTATNRIEHVTYLGRAPHEAFFTRDGRELWVTVRGENYVAVIDTSTYEEKTRIPLANGPGMQIFSPDGRYAYVCSSFTPETIVFDVATRERVGRVQQLSPFCPNIAATPDGTQVWLTLKDVGRAMVFDAHPPFALIRTLDTGPITNHVNFVRNARGTFAYITIGGLDCVKVYRTDDFGLEATIPTGKLPHGIWPSGDGTRVYVGLENDDQLLAIDTATNRNIALVPIGQAPQAVVYVSNAVPTGDGTQGLEPLGVSAAAAHLTLRSTNVAIDRRTPDPTSVALFDQGLVQVLEASVTNLSPGSPYILALAERADGTGTLQGLSAFTTNGAGAAIVNAIGPIRQLVLTSGPTPARFLVIAEGNAAAIGAVVQVQAH